MLTQQKLDACPTQVTCDLIFGKALSCITDHAHGQGSRSWSTSCTPARRPSWPPSRTWSCSSRSSDSPTRSEFLKGVIIRQALNFVEFFSCCPILNPFNIREKVEISKVMTTCPPNISAGCRVEVAGKIREIRSSQNCWDGNCTEFREKIV